MIHPGVFIGKKKRKYWQEQVKQEHNFDLLLHGQKNNSFLTAYISSGIFSDVYKVYFCLKQEGLTIYTDADSCLSASCEMHDES